VVDEESISVNLATGQNTCRP